MKKLSLLLVLILCLSLCACGQADVEEIPAARDVQIKAGRIEAGMIPRDIFVEVTIDGQPVACEVELTRFTETGYYVMAADEAVPENFYGRLDVYYSLPEGVDLDSSEVTMVCDGGEYDGTGSVGNDANGCVEAWSHAIYGTEPAATEPVHTHDWNKDESKSGIAGCNFDGYTVYVCDCGESYRKTIPALGHDYAEPSITPPTCTRTGYQTTYCKRCGEGLFSEIPATGHSWSQWTYENGRVHVRTCSVCGEREEADHSIPSGTVTCTDCGMDIVN